MNEDSISRAAACNTICDSCDHAKAVCAHYPCKQYLSIEELPPAHPEEVTTIFGYPVRHLAAIAKALEDEDITPENVANLVSQMEYIAEKMIDEFSRLGEKWAALFGEEPDQ